MSEYNHRAIEPKWRKSWKDNETYKVTEDTNKEKFYVLDMFPYPSGAGLHVGHPLGYIASDIYARYKRAQGFNVLHPMGYDSFGLPAEQYAIQTGQHPAITTEKNIERYRDQLDQIGFSFDWSREVRTSDPKYYKWTQWIFKQIFNSWYNKSTDKAENIADLVAIFEKEGNANVNAVGEETPVFSAEEWNAWDIKKQRAILMNYRLAYLADSWVNWCPALGTVLANDEVKDGVSERGGHPVEQKLMRQWSMRITAYAERLLQGLDKIDFSDSLKEQQKNWIGKSQGASVKFGVENLQPSSEVSEFNLQHQIEVFTTRPDTIFGVSFMVLAPEHPLVNLITTPEQKDAIEAYQKQASLKSERDRQSDVKNITGAFTGAYAIHPFTGNKIPVWIGDYVLASYGTGAVMAVPSGDQRDWDFATHFGIDIPNVFEGVDISKGAYAEKEGVIANSDFLNGLKVKDAIKKAIHAIEEKGIGTGKTNYRLRDAIFSRQRYWGEPFPVYYQDEIPYLIEDADLPVTLPEVDKYLPTEDGEPPLARAENWFYKADVKSTSPQPSPEERESDEDDVEEGSGEGFYKTTDVKTWFRLKEFARENRKNQTRCEKIIWQEVRGSKLGCRFRRQQVIDNYIADFVSFSSMLILEIDGEIHNRPSQQIYDAKRTQKLNELGFNVLRIDNKDVLENLDEVVEKIKANLKTNSSLPTGEGQGGVDSRMEFNTMPGWAGSSWYFLRYMDPHNENEFASKDKLEYWNQVDLYIGGAEHATGHLLYSRFWTKFLHDRGFISFDEPFKKLINQGMILGRSSFVYRLSNHIIHVISDSKSKLPMFLYFSNSWVKIIEQEGFSPFVIELINKTLKNKNIEIEVLKIEEATSNFQNVDIKYVDNDVLDIENACKDSLFSSFFQNALFIPEEDGKFICGHEVEKMSKSKYNVQTPDELVEKFGADTLRCYEMFLGPLEQFKPWDVKGINGVNNFLRKLWRLFHQRESFNISNEAPSKEALKTLHKTIKKITEDLDRYSFNTVVSTLMIAVNELTEQKCNNQTILEGIIILLAPYAPHISEELWEKLGHTKSITQATWPTFDPAMLVEDDFEYPVSFNGKMKFKLLLPTSLNPKEVEEEVMKFEKTIQILEGKSPKKVIVVPKKIVNVVV
jgi:leucyl-tRNA synthetase/very-short-patch-repair endonuclease